MSKYTTELRYICENASGLTESMGQSSVNEIINKSMPKIFNFSFPIFDENYRNVLETKIIRHYYTREIAFETVGLWKLKLETLLNEIMPYYNKLYETELLEFNPLYSFEHNKESNRSGADTSHTEGANTTNTTNISDSNVNSTREDVSRQMYSDTPQGALNGVEDGTYLTNATKNMSNGSDGTTAHEILDGNVQSTNESTGNFTNTEDYLEHIYGRNESGSELLIKYRKTFLNIDMMVIDELEDLFLHLW